MAFLFADGADLYGTASNVSRKWSTSASLTIVAGRLGGGAIRLDSAGSQVTKTIANTITIGVTFALNIQAANTGGSVRMLLLTDTGTCQVGLGTNASQQIILFRNTTANILATSVESLSQGVWHQLELKVKIDNTVGTVELRLNGNTTPIITATGLDTQQTANAFVNDIRFTTDGNGTPDFDIDDIIFWDDTGAAPHNNFLGDARIETLQPTGAGNTTQWAVTGAASNFQAVDDTTPNDDTDYVSENVSGEKDTYATGNVTGTVDTIYAVQTNLLMKKSDAGTADVQHVVRSNAVDYLSAAKTPGTSYAYSTELWLTDPDTDVAWTQSAVDAAEYGEQFV